MYDPTTENRSLAPLFIAPDVLISEGLRQMDDSGAKILFVAAEDRRLLGVATDGDVRRWILGGSGLDHPIAEAMNPVPISLPEGHALEQAREIMVARRIDCIPVLDDQGRVLSAIWWTDLFEAARPAAEQIDIPVVVMAGGEGSRLAPYTKVLPKPLIPIGETPIVELIIERFVAHGCREVYLTVNYKANLIKAYFKDIAHDYEVNFVDEPEPLGTAGSLAMLKGVLESTFFVSNCDILIDADYADVLKFHRESGNRLTLVGSMKRFTIPYGVCQTAAGGQLVGISEKPSYDYLVSTGMYVMEPEALDDIPPGRVYHVTDLINDCVAAGAKVGVYPISEKSWMDMGQFEELAGMRTRLGLE
jgi:dTDP-glucose pyrophosphorylase